MAAPPAHLVLALQNMRVASANFKGTEEEVAQLNEYYRSALPKTSEEKHTASLFYALSKLEAYEFAKYLNGSVLEPYALWCAPLTLSNVSRLSYKIFFEEGKDHIYNLLLHGKFGKPRMPYKKKFVPKNRQKPQPDEDGFIEAKGRGKPNLVMASSANSYAARVGSKPIEVDPKTALAALEALEVEAEPKPVPKPTSKAKPSKPTESPPAEEASEQDDSDYDE